MFGKVWPDEPTAFPDYFRQETKDWWINEIEQFHEMVSFDGIWIDMNEPANFETNNADNEDALICDPESKYENPPYPTSASRNGMLSDKTICMVGQRDERRQYDYHSLYGWAESEPTLIAAQRVTGKRGFVISRSTFPSAGKYTGHWLGDNTSRWKDLKSSIIGMFEFNLFGIPYVGADICGFFEEAEEHMCRRWMQLGAFYPFSRNHNGIDNIDQDPGMWESVANASKVL